MIPWYGLLPLLSICCALVGWLTNVIAVRMIFFPIEPRRWLGLRFQGVLPKHHRYFAREMAQVVTEDFMTTGELVRRLDPVALYERLLPRLERLLEQVLQQVRGALTEQQRAILLGPGAVQAARRRLERELQDRLPRGVAQLARRADSVLDLNELIAEKLLRKGPRRFVEMIRRLGAKELVWIQVYGGLFGLLIGVIQFAMLSVFPARYSLVVVGFMVGAVTNFLALKMLFFPRRPLRLGPLRFQGLFPRRQGEIAAELARVAASRFIVADRIFARLVQELLPTPAREEGLEAAQIAKLEDSLFRRYPALRGLVAATLDPEKQQELRRQLALIYRREAPALAAELVQEAADQLDVLAILRGKVEVLSKLRFETFIRQLFKEEEITLIIYGGLMGAGLGAMELALMLLRRWI